MQLRKCCNHPYLFPGAEPDFDGVHTGALPCLLSASMLLFFLVSYKMVLRGTRGCGCIHATEVSCLMVMQLNFWQSMQLADAPVNRSMPCTN